MVLAKSLDDSIYLIAALLRDIQMLRNDVFDQRTYRLTIQKIAKRCEREGMGFLTKTLPRLGKALDRALTGECCIDSVTLGFKPKKNSKLPMLMGELFELVLDNDGKVLPSPCVSSIKQLRDFCYLFYKYKLPYTARQEQRVINDFIKAEDDIRPFNKLFETIKSAIDHKCGQFHSYSDQTTSATLKEVMDDGLDSVFPISKRMLIRRARALLNQVFVHFDPTDIRPKHGPGVVSTKERLYGKYFFRNVSSRITDVYPLDAYFYASLGHICDSVQEIQSLGTNESNARVLLVPKDSRGPRLISCEPLEVQWIQQGLGRAIVEHVELHPLTRYNVHFTDQQPNQLGALLGSVDGLYSTLDLKEASDRVTVGLVRLLFPDRVLPYLLASRSLATQLPDGSIVNLNKFAPMGSALCFPILALTVWAILTAGTTDADARESILVYGDDVIVRTDHSAYAIEQLESFGLKVNRDKSCVSGFFRESCGVDAYKGNRVTPLRFRNVWPSTPSPESYESWIAYANSAYDRKYFNLYETIVNNLYKLYGPIAGDELCLGVPSLREVPVHWKPLRKRVNNCIQNIQYRCLVTKTRPIKRSIDGWKMLNRYFAETASTSRHNGPLGSIREQTEVYSRTSGGPSEGPPFSVSSYTKRNSAVMSYRWCSPKGLPSNGQNLPVKVLGPKAYYCNTGRAAWL